MSSESPDLPRSLGGMVEDSGEKRNEKWKKQPGRQRREIKKQTSFENPGNPGTRIFPDPGTRKSGYPDLPRNPGTRIRDPVPEPEGSGPDRGIKPPLSHHQATIKPPSSHHQATHQATVTFQWFSTIHIGLYTPISD